MAITRHHYLMLADALKAARTDAQNATNEGVARAAALIGIDFACLSIAYVLAQDNGAFDRERFLKNAGVGN